MKINENQKIISNKSILVPYEAQHVPKYHNWMEDENIRRLTGSEILTMEQELEMQKSWRNDEDKLTFIVLDKSKYDISQNEEESMVGDVNLFIDMNEKTAEVEIMIAEIFARGKGIGSEAVSLIISYAIKELNIKNFFAKITDDNDASLHLFEKKLYFNRISHSEVFGEYTLELPPERIPEFENFIFDYAFIDCYKK